MTLVLDTHVVLWALLEPDRLTEGAGVALRNPANQVFVSAVTAWEVTIKQSLGKLVLPGPADVWLPVALERTGFDWLPVTPTEALAVGRLPWHHRDPFDRLLVAQIHSGRTLVTHDRAMEAYGVPVLWA